MWQSSTLAWLAYATACVAQSQYESSPPVYPSRKQPYFHVAQNQIFGIFKCQVPIKCSNCLFWITAQVSGAGGWEDALTKAKAFVAELTLDEKADMVTGMFL